jgi:zinc transport system substrate-binding protein
MRRLMRPVGRIVIAMLLVLCSGQVVFAEERLQVYTVNYPLAYFAERIVGDLAEVTFPPPPDVDPAFWMPDPKTIAAYQGADLILLNGADYAKWMSKVSLPLSRLVDTSRGFEDQYIQQANLSTHSHGPGGEHTHGGVAFNDLAGSEPSRATSQSDRPGYNPQAPGGEGAD